MVGCMLSPMTVVTYASPRAICRSTLNGIWIGRFVRPGAGGMCGRRMRTVPSGSRSSVPRYSQSLIVTPFGGVFALGEGRWSLANRAAQNGMSTGSLKTLVRTLIEPASRNGFWRVFSVGFVPEDERHRAEHPQFRALGDDAKLFVQERARTVLLPVAAHEHALAHR